MTPKDTVSIYKDAYKKADDWFQEYARHPMKPFAGPGQIWSFLKGYFNPPPSVGYADPVPFGTRLRAFFSRNPAAVINGTPVRPGRTYAKR